LRLYFPHKKEGNSLEGGGFEVEAVFPSQKRRQLARKGVLR